MTARPPVPALSGLPSQAQMAAYFAADNIAQKQRRAALEAAAVARVRAIRGAL